VEAELERLRNVEAASREQASALAQAVADSAAAREDAEAIREQFNTSALVARQQMLVVRCLQHDLTLQAKNWQAAMEQLDAAKEQLRTAKEQLRATEQQLGAAKQEVARYALAYNQLSSLIIPVWMRKSVPTTLRRPLRALKRAIRALMRTGRSEDLHTS
jgi:hypothetical protein